MENFQVADHSLHYLTSLKKVLFGPVLVSGLSIISSFLISYRYMATAIAN